MKQQKCPKCKSECINTNGEIIHATIYDKCEDCGTTWESAPVAPPESSPTDKAMEDVVERVGRAYRKAEADRVNYGPCPKCQFERYSLKTGTCGHCGYSVPPPESPSGWEVAKREFDFMVKPEHSERLWYVIKSLIHDHDAAIVKRCRDMKKDTYTPIGPSELKHYNQALEDVIHMIEEVSK